MPSQQHKYREDSESDTFHLPTAIVIWRHEKDRHSALSRLYYHAHDIQPIQDMAKTTFTFRVNSGLKNDFVTATKSLDRTGAQVLRSNMREIVRQQPESVSHDDWFRHEVQAGLDSAQAGHLVDADTVEGKFAARRARIRHQTDNL